MSELNSLSNEFRAYKASRLLSVAFQKQVPHCLLNNALTLAEIAKIAGIQEPWLIPIMGILADRKLVQKKHERFELTKLGKEAVTDESLNAIAGYHFHCFDSWSYLPEALNSGHGGQFHKKRLADPEFIISYLKAMDAIARNSLSFLFDRCYSILARDVIDIGAGPATLTRQICLNNHITKVTALDFPEISSMAKKIFNVSPNFTWEPEDFWQWNPGKQVDSVFCSHFLEYLDIYEFNRSIQRIKGYLKAGGDIVLVTFLRQKGGCADLDLFELSTGLNGSSLGHIFDEKEIRLSLAANNLSVYCFETLPNGPSFNEVLICCRKD